MANDPADTQEPDKAGDAKLQSLTQLRSNQCKWPVSEDKAAIGHFLFCGRPTDGTNPYCTEHRSIAVAKPLKRGVGQ
jgi:hypothetical protein